MATGSGWWAMAHSHSTELSPGDQLALLQMARQAVAIELGSEHQPVAGEQSPAMAMRRGVFVTLTRSGALRGCIGTLESDQPLMQSVPECARGDMPGNLSADRAGATQRREP